MKSLEELQAFPFENATASLWIIKKRVQDKQAIYTARWVEVAGEAQGDFNLEAQLITTVQDVIGIQKDTLDYDFVCNPDEFCLLQIDAAETNMPLIIEKVSVPGNEHAITNEKELLNAAGYLIKVQSGDQKLYAFKKTTSSWKASKVKSGRWAFFNGECMMGISQDSVFQIHKDVDFICFEDTVFIADKRSFESAMNFKDSMIERRDEVINAIEESGIFSDVDVIQTFIGEDMRYLRSISSIMDKGYYAQHVFIGRLKAKNLEHNWGIDVGADGKINPTEETMPLLLRLLNDFRLFSELSHNIYDVPSTQVVG
ncbi:MAG: Kiwa anti-phage protein KwaB-like domain-containing protein [Desulfovibrionaceae bacterium]